MLVSLFLSLGVNRRPPADVPRPRINRHENPRKAGACSVVLPAGAPRPPLQMGRLGRPGLSVPLAGQEAVTFAPVFLPVV